MSLQGPIVVVAERPASDLVAALSAAGAFPIIETNWTDAPASFVSIKPCAVIIAEPGPPPSDASARMLCLQIATTTGPVTPVIALTSSDRDAAIPIAIAADQAQPAETTPAQTGVTTDAVTPTEVQPPARPSDAGEIVVTGFRGSLRSALSEKRRANVQVDVINAEDIAEFPDANLAFDFYLDHYNAQLVAGYEKNTPDHGLIVVMQDYSRTPPLPGETRHRKHQPASVSTLPRSRRRDLQI